MEDIFLKLGYKKVEKEKIMNSHAVNRFSLPTLEKKVINTFNYFKNKGYRDSDIIKMTVINAALFNYSDVTLDSRFVFLRGLGYSEEEIKNMSIILPAILTISNQNIIEKINYFENLGYFKSVIHKMTSLVPSLFSLSIEKLNEKRDFFQRLGFSDKDINKMTKDTPSIYTHSLDSLNEKIEYLRALGYGKRIYNMLLRCSNIMGLSLKTLDSKRDFFFSFGYSLDEVNYITGVNPKVFVLGDDNLNNKIKFFLDLGYSLEDVRLITVKVPTVFSYSTDGIKEKIDILKKAQLDGELLSRPSYLMQSADLSYGRLNYLIKNGFTLDHRAFNYLVMSNKDFMGRFGLSNDEVKGLK